MYSDKQSADAYQSLFNELRGALLNDPFRFIYVPSWVGGRATAVRVIDDSFAESDGDEVLAELINICAQAARGANVKDRALQWIDDRCRAFANAQRDDFLEREQYAAEWPANRRDQ